jgi:hypothetical protein
MTSFQYVVEFTEFFCLHFRVLREGTIAVRAMRNRQTSRILLKKVLRKICFKNLSEDGKIIFTPVLKKHCSYSRENSWPEW